MVKKVLSMVMFLVGTLCVSAQMPQLTPLPVNPKIKSGVLPNGMSYYIMHNEMPKQRANFYIAQKVGSTLEEQNQLGLAHFLEHMAFNGTSHYPGKSLLNYLQGKGIRFGADINAYTAFDETVYNINNVITTDQPLMDSVLLALHDWSCDLLLEEAEIDAERGVIQEEWRQRNDANFRMLSTVLPAIYQEYQYQQTPIGKMEVVMNFKPEALRAYYKKWYRPDQQGIVIVGDFDAEELEKKVKELFSPIKMPANAAERKYPVVSDNEKPIYVSFTDPELSQPRTTISFKSEKIPFEMRNTLEMYVQDSMLESLVSGLFNNRIGEISQDPNCKYLGAGVYFGDYYVSKTKSSFNIAVIPKNGTLPAVEQVMGIVAQACQKGFSDTEYDRVKQDIMASLETSLNNKDKTSNDAFGKEICRLFIDNVPAPGIEKEVEIWKQILPNIPIEAINQHIKTLLTPNNMVIVTTEPQQDGFEIVAEDVMVKAISDAMSASYDAYIDETVDEPLIASLPAPGKIVKTESNSKFDYTMFTLSNGVKVIAKPTNFAGDQIMMNAFREGGVRAYPESQAANLKLVETVYATSKKGPFDNKTLSKYLTGKTAGFGIGINTYTDALSGSSTVKDLPTLMELIYTAFTNISADTTQYNLAVEAAKIKMKNAEKDPQTIYGKELAKTRYGDNPFALPATLATFDQADYDEMLGMIRKMLSNAADYTFIFVGNIDMDTFKPLVEQYIATLPASTPGKQKVVSDIELRKGQIKNEFKQKMATPSTSIYDIYSDNNVPFNMKNNIMMNMTGDILDIIFTETLREEEGGTYGASVSAGMNANNGEWNVAYYFQTNKDQQEQMIKRADAEFVNLLQNGAKAEHFNKVKQAMLKQLEISLEKNGYWMNGILSDLRGHDVTTGQKEAIEGITLEELNRFMKNLYNGKNRIQVIMEGIPVE